jgi:hypothetical protein
MSAVYRLAVRAPLSNTSSGPGKNNHKLQLDGKDPRIAQILRPGSFCGDPGAVATAKQSLFSLSQFVYSLPGNCKGPISALIVKVAIKNGSLP